MRAKLFATAMVLACPALAQTDGPAFAAGLRSKFGPPLLRETFTARPGIEMVVDYAANGNVCRLQLPPIAPLSRDPHVSSPQAIDEFVLELIPASLRGKELGQSVFTSGPNSVSFTNYENVTVAIGLHGFDRTGVTVTFVKEQCRDRRE